MKVNRLISSLVEVASKYPHDEKLLIVPNHNTGLQILECLARAKEGWANFRPATLLSLALEEVEHILVSRNINHISGRAVFAIIDRIFNLAAEEGRLCYFERHPANRGIVQALTETLLELRYNGISSVSFADCPDLRGKKADDISLLLSGYEDFLEGTSFIDAPGVLCMALENGGREFCGKRRLFVPRNSLFQPVELRLIEKIDANYEIIAEDAAFGLDRPKLCLEAVSAPDISCSSDTERLKWLFANASAPPPFNDKTVDIFSGLGRENEIRQVLRKITDEKIPADRVEIVCTDLKEYADIIYSCCMKTGTAVTFADGIPYYMTKTGQALRMFLLWIKNDFHEIYLRNLLESGSFKHPLLDKKGAPVASTLGHLLRVSGVGWQRERYPVILASRIKETVEAAARMEARGDKDFQYYKTKSKNLGVLKELCSNLIEMIPEVSDGMLEFPRICQACKTFLNRHVRVTGDQEAIFAAEAVQQLDIVSQIFTSNIGFDEAVEKIFGIVSYIRIEPSNPRPGHIHVSHYKSGGRTGRDNTFIVGLDNDRFPVRLMQDPVLLDQERESLNASMELMAESAGKDLYRMASLVAGLRGRVAFSYSAYDIQEDRKSFPSSILLQAHRLNTGNLSANYRDLTDDIGEPAGFEKGAESETYLDSTDWWVSNIASTQNLKDARDSIKRIFAGTGLGMRAAAERQSTRFTEYDGWIESDGDTLDPRKNSRLVMSSTRLETAAKCPFLYYIKHVLHIKIPEETQKDITAWLNPLERGQLLHEVFQLFTNELIGAGNPPATEAKGLLLNKILGRTIDRYKEKIPPYSQRIFLNECERLRKEAVYFLKMNEQLGTPVFCEEVFGQDGSFMIEFGNGSRIKLQGKIDRIDQQRSDEYAVWDYKTGGTSNYRESENIKGGEQLQHCLYAVAAEDILIKKHGKKAAKVVSSGYLFPTEKGMARGSSGKFVRPAGDQWEKALDLLLDIIGGGIFMARSKNAVKDLTDSCRYCDYVDICGGERARREIDRKLENEDNKMLEKWKRLKEYE